MNLWGILGGQWLNSGAALPGHSEAFGDPNHAPLDKALLGAHARRLLNDEVLSLAFDKVERELMATWRSTALGEAKQREAAYAEVWALEAVRAKLRAFLNDLKMIEAEQERKEAAEKAKREHRDRVA